MADWRKELDLRVEWEKTQEGEMTNSALCKVIHERLTKLYPEPSRDMRLTELMEEFQTLADLQAIWESEGRMAIREADTINTVEKQAIVDAALAWADAVNTPGATARRIALLDAVKRYKAATEKYGTFTSEGRCCMGGPRGRGCTC